MPLRTRIKWAIINWKNRNTVFTEPNWYKYNL